MREKSLMLVKTPRISEAATTMTVESRNSGMVGQVAFLSSSTISMKKMRVELNGFFMAINLAGAEGLEPPTDGFGDRYSTN